MSFTNPDIPTTWFDNKEIQVFQAELQPLGGKYYGTGITLNPGHHSIQVWINDDSGMSGREEAVARDALEMLDDPLEKVEEQWLCDCHYETRTSYVIASLLCEAINNAKLTLERIK